MLRNNNYSMIPRTSTRQHYLTELAGVATSYTHTIELAGIVRNKPANHVQTHTRSYLGTANSN